MNDLFKAKIEKARHAEYAEMLGVKPDALGIDRAYRIIESLDKALLDVCGNFAQTLASLDSEDARNKFYDSLLTESRIELLSALSKAQEEAAKFSDETSYSERDRKTRKFVIAPEPGYETAQKLIEFLNRAANLTQSQDSS